MVALSGGVGGAKLALGLSRARDVSDLSIVVNTGDDFEHFGLHVSPDLDTMMYTLAGINNPETGWGRADETWSFMSALRDLSEQTWFQLGDKDLATNVCRTDMLRRGATLSDVVSQLSGQLGVRESLVPMTDDKVRTLVETDAGDLSFQDYFVRQQCQPRVKRIRFQGAGAAKPSPEFLSLLENPDVGSWIICPSNPFLSIDPILALPSVKARIRTSPAPVIAVSPVINNESVKGPTSKIMRELGKTCSVVEVADYYRDLIDCMLIDTSDKQLAPEIENMGIRVELARILMSSDQDKIDLAETLVSISESW